MVYQRRMPKEELLAAQLEMLIQNGRLATVSSHLIGVAASMAIFWPFVDVTIIMLWAAAFLILLLLRSNHMSSSLANHSYRDRAKSVYWKLVLGSAATGAVWAAVYIFAASRVPITMQYTFLLLIVMITAISMGFSVIVREYFVAYLFASLWPIAWWSLVHYWEQPYNLLIGLALLAFCAVLVAICDRVHRSFRNMINLNWEREAIAQELGNLTNSLRDRNRQLRDARRQLTELANIDDLTGLGNRRMVNSSLQAEINRARRTGSYLSIILLDVDYFKNYNDTYGHPAGDRVLRTLAGLMQRVTTRAGEVVARYGGEEFLLVLPSASSKSAMRTASHLQELVLEEAIAHKSSLVADVLTVSQGVVTERPDANTSPEELIQRADKALYEAKEQGRNTIVIRGAQQNPPTDPARV